MKKSSKTNVVRRVLEKRTLGQRTLLWVVIFASLAIALSFTSIFRDTPTEMAQKEMAKVADDYYIRYLYPTLLGNVFTANPEEKLKPYVEIGTTTTYLRQLLLYDNGRYAASGPVFESLGCDTNITSVRYFPVAPFGPRDYTLQYNWKCDKMEK